MEHSSQHEASWIPKSVHPSKSLLSRWSSPRYEKRCDSPIMFTLWRNELILFCFLLLDEHWRDFIIYSHWYWRKPFVCYSWTQSCSYGISSLFNFSLLWRIKGARCIRYWPKSSWSWEISRRHEDSISLSDGGRRRYCLYSPNVVASSHLKASSCLC